MSERTLKEHTKAINESFESVFTVNNKKELESVSEKQRDLEVTPHEKTEAASLHLCGSRNGSSSPSQIKIAASPVHLPLKGVRPLPLLSSTRVRTT